MPFLKRQNSVFLTTLIGLILIGILICLPTGYEDALIYQGTERAVGKVCLLYTSPSPRDTR